MWAFGLFVATAGYVGYFPVAPGTAGSAVGLTLVIGIRVFGSPGLELGVLVVTVVLGLWAAGVGERYAAREGPGPGRDRRGCWHAIDHALGSPHLGDGRGGVPSVSFLRFRLSHFRRATLSGFTAGLGLWPTT